MTIQVNDTFTASDGTLLSAHTSDSGHTYTRWTSSETTTSPSIASNELTRNGASGRMIWIPSWTPSSGDYKARARVLFGGATADVTGVIVRILDDAVTANRRGYFVNLNPGSGGVRIQKFISSNWQAVTSRNFGLTTANAGESYDLYLQATDVAGPAVQLEVWVQRVSDGQWVTTGGGFSATEQSCIVVTDSTSPITGAGQPAVALYGQASASTVPDWAVDDMAAGDTTPPVITGPGGATGATSSVTVNENTTTVHTFTADESVTWSLNGGADAALFSINSSTGALAFLSAPDFEAPADADTNNVYVVVVRATDGASNATDQTVSVTVADVAEGSPPTITSQPSSTSRKVGQTATFSVTATGTAPITYQWRLNGSPISGATSSSYTTGTLAIGDNGGVYSVAVTDPNGTTVSSGATLTVTACTLDLSAVRLTDIVGLDLSGISDAAGVSVRSEAYAEGLTLGSPVATSSAAATSGTGVPASITDPALQFGATYVVIITEQAGSAPRRRAMVEVVAG